MHRLSYVSQPVELQKFGYKAFDTQDDARHMTLCGAVMVHGTSAVLQSLEYMKMKGVGVVGGRTAWKNLERDIRFITEETGYSCSSSFSFHVRPVDVDTPKLFAFRRLTTNKRKRSPPVRSDV